MSGHEWEIAVLGVGAVLTAIIQTLFRRAEKTGERLGRLEKAADFERGRQAGLREARRRKENER